MLYWNWNGYLDTSILQQFYKATLFVLRVFSPVKGYKIWSFRCCNTRRNAIKVLHLNLAALYGWIYSGRYNPLTVTSRRSCVVGVVLSDSTLAYLQQCVFALRVGLQCVQLELRRPAGLSVDKNQCELYILRLPTSI